MIAIVAMVATLVALVALSSATSSPVRVGNLRYLALQPFSTVTASGLYNERFLAICVRRSRKPGPP